jgi:glycosyltransferase involved in cell wall biosynthesis
VKVDVVDPPAYSPPYDHALSTALARAGAEVRLVTSRFAYSDVPAASGYARRELFYRHVRGAAGSQLRKVTKLAEHVPDMLHYRTVARSADVVHFQWLDFQWLDHRLLPDRPVVLTAHDLLPREPRPGQARAQRRLYDRVAALITHSEYGRAQLVEALGLDPRKVHVVHHGAFEHLTEVGEEPLPEPLLSAHDAVVLFFGLLRPYKGLEVLLDAWQSIPRGELWIVGRSRMPLAPLQARAPTCVRFLSRFISDAELAAVFRRADLVVLPYSRTERFDQSGVLATALAFGKPIVLTDVGSFGEVAATGAARLVPPDDPTALRAAIADLLADPTARERLAAAAVAAARGPYSWDGAAVKTLELYQQLV